MKRPIVRFFNDENKSAYTSVRENIFLFFFLNEFQIVYSIINDYYDGLGQVRKRYETFGQEKKKS